LKVKISVIIPVYNVENYLSKCISSVVNQTFKDIEIICINDGSTDSSLDILNTYAKNDNRMIIVHESNHGQGYCRNLALKMAQGQYIMFVDSDDFILDVRAIEFLYTEITLKELDVLIYSYEKYYEKKNIILNSSSNNKHLLSNKIYVSIADKKDIFSKKSIGVPWNKLYSNNFLQQNNILFNEEYLYEDVIFFYKSIILANKIGYLDKILYSYRKNGKSTMSVRDNRNLNIIHVYAQVKDFLLDNHLYAYYRISFTVRCVKALMYKFKHIPLRFKKEYFTEVQIFLKDIDIEMQKNALGKNYNKFIAFKKANYWYALIRFGLF
jgi:glycosyltransferase involved in cell wall biosynthesis